MEVECNICALFGACSSEPHSEECQEKRQCEFCMDYGKGIRLYVLSDYVNSFTFDPIPSVSFCPCCGKELEDSIFI